MRVERFSSPAFLYVLEGKVLVDFAARSGRNRDTRQDCLPMLYEKADTVVTRHADLLRHAA